MTGPGHEYDPIERSHPFAIMQSAATFKNLRFVGLRGYEHESASDDCEKLSPQYPMGLQ